MINRSLRLHTKQRTCGRWGTIVALLLGTAGMASAQPGADAPSTTAAQTADTQALAELLDLEIESVFGASRYLQRLTEAPAAVSVVTADDIARYGWRTLADVLRSVRGLYITDDRAYGYVGIRGFQRPGDYNTRMLILVDGHRVNDNVYSQAFLQDDLLVDLQDVERIEVVRGPSSSLYGSSAFFGVINVITKPVGGGGSGSVSAEIGTMGLQSARARAAHTTASGLALDISATLAHADGMRNLYLSAYDTPETNRGVASGLDYADRQNVVGRLRFGTIDVRTGYNMRTRGVPTAAYGTRFNDPRTAVTDTRAFVNGSWDGKAPLGWTARGRFSYDAYGFDGVYPYDAGESDEVVTYLDWARGRWLTTEMQVSRQAAGHRIVTGVELQYNLQQDQRGTEQEPGVEVFGDRRRSRNAAFYVQDEWRVHKTLLLSAGLRGDRSSMFGGAVMPRAAAILQPDARTTIKLTYGEAFRAPTVFEAFSFVPGLSSANPDLRAEDIRSTELTIDRYLGRRLRISAGAFSSQVERLIDYGTDPLDGLALFENLSTAHARGLDAEVEAKWPSRAQARISYTFADAYDGVTGLVLDNAPAHLGQALMAVPFVRGTSLALDARALSPRQTWSGERTAAHLVTNVTWSGALARDRMRFSLTLTNLANQRYADPVGADFAQSSVPQNGRAAHGRVIWAF